MEYDKIEERLNIDRGLDGIECTCGGYAKQVDCTLEEEAKYGCGHIQCCSRAFVCRVCKTRIVGNAAAPDMDRF